MKTKTRFTQAAVLPAAMAMFASLLPAAMLKAGGAIGPGSLDPSFGGTGIVTTAIGTVDDVANGVVVQPDGKIVLGGFSRTGAAGSRTENFALARYTSAGILDPTFNGTGKRTDNLALYGVEDAIYGVGLQADGKIVAGGYIFTNVWGAEISIGIARYNAGGTLDTSFGSNGHREFWYNSASRNFGATTGKKGFVMQPDGKTVMAGGLVDNNYGKIDFSVVRCGTNGIEDPTFGTNGRVRTEHVGYWNYVNYGHDIAWDVALQADGKIVVVGESLSFSSTQFPASYNTDFSVVRYNTDGSLDSSFEGDGIAITPISADKKDDVATTVTVQSNGRIIVAGYTYNTAKAANNFALTRYLTDGSLDASFGTGGKVVTSLGAGNDMIYDMVIDGAFIVVAGVTNNGSNNDFAVARYTMNGALDPTFGVGGIRTFGIGSGNDQANAITIDTQGQYVVAGSSFNGSNDDFVAARLIAGPQAPTAVTLDATGITSTSATLNGTINAHGSSTTITFEYGPDTGYGTTVTATQSPATGHVTTAVSAPTGVLSVGATYHYRVKGVSIDGITYGDDMTFDTLAVVPPAPITFTIGGTPGDASTGSNAPDSTGTGSDGTKFDVLQRGGYLAENGNLVFPGTLQIGVGGVTVNPNNFQGYWKHDGSTLKRIARSGDAAPETGATPAVFNILPLIPGINDDGQVTLYCSLLQSALSNPATTADNDVGIWSELGGTGFQILMREGDTIPGLGGPMVDTMGYGCFATAKTSATTGEAAFVVGMKNGSTDTALLRCSVVNSDTTAVGVVARENTPAPGGSGENFNLIHGGYTGAVRMDSSGNVVFAGWLKPSGRLGIWYQDQATKTVSKTALAGEAAAGTTATFQSIDLPSMGGGGTYAFRAVLNSDGDNIDNSKNDGIWKGTATAAPTLILRRGDSNTNRPGLFTGAILAANPSIKAGNIYNGWLTNANHGAWLGWVDLGGDGINAYPTDTFGVYSDTSGTMTLIAASGQAAPGIAGANFFFIDHPLCGGVEQVAFIATVSGGGVTAGANDKGVWRTAANGGALNLVLRTGDSIVTTQGAKTIADVDLPGSNYDDHIWETPVMDATGRMIVFVTCTDGSTTEVLAP